MPARVALLALMIGCTGWDAARAQPTEANAAAEERTDVLIQHRQFIPGRTVLHQGQVARLRFRNLDSELHSIVPAGWLSGEHLSVSGNGAPEFGPEGLKRVIIPPEGEAEIRFTPKTPGEYAYRCDMPGHQMNAAIVVE